MHDLDWKFHSLSLYSISFQMLYPLQPFRLVNVHLSSDGSIFNVRRDQQSAFQPFLLTTGRNSFKVNNSFTNYLDYVFININFKNHIIIFFNLFFLAFGDMGSLLCLMKIFWNARQFKENNSLILILFLNFHFFTTVASHWQWLQILKGYEKRQQFLNCSKVR